jgi:hypothetical protein
MPPQTHKPVSAPRRPATPPGREANGATKTTLESERVLAGIDDFVETLADLRTEVLLGALEASNRRKGIHMADRPLTANAAIAKVTSSSDIEKLKEGEEATRTIVAAIRAQVQFAQVQDFDNKLDELVHGKL